MKRISALALFVLLSCSSPALAAGQDALFTKAEHRAEEFWGRMPPCGHPHIFFISQPVGSQTAGEANYALCSISIFSSGEWSTPRERVLAWPRICLVMTHEWGHLVLGPDYYTATNPSEPAHSANIYNIMYAQDLYPYPESCLPAAFNVGGTVIRWSIKDEGAATSILCHIITPYENWNECDDLYGVDIEGNDQAYEV